MNSSTKSPSPLKPVIKKVRVQRYQEQEESDQIFSDYNPEDYVPIAKGSPLKVKKP